MNRSIQNTCTAFSGLHRIAVGHISQVAGRAKEALEKDPNAQILIFDNVTSDVVEIDLRGTVADVLKRLAKETGPDALRPDPELPGNLEPRGPGRPKLGVIAREVTLLPRHWEWLNTQPGGASVALRKLVEKAKRDHAGRDLIRQAQESSFKFMSVMAGNLPNFEEAARALFAGDGERFNAWVEPWPADVREHAKTLTAAVFQA